MRCAARCRSGRTSCRCAPWRGRGSGSASRPPVRPPRSPAWVSPAPGAVELAGASRSPGEPGAAAGLLTSPHRQPRRLGGGEGRGRGCAPSRFPPGSPSAATWRRHGQSRRSRVRPSCRVVSAAKPTPQRWKHRRHLIVKEGAPRSRCTLQPLLLSPPRGPGHPFRVPSR